MNGAGAAGRTGARGRVRLRGLAQRTQDIDAAGAYEAPEGDEVAIVDGVRAACAGMRVYRLWVFPPAGVPSRS